MGFIRKNKLLPAIVAGILTVVICMFFFWGKKNVGAGQESEGYDVVEESPTQIGTYVREAYNESDEILSGSVEDKLSEISRGDAVTEGNESTECVFATTSESSEGVIFEETVRRKDAADSTIESSTPDKEMIPEASAAVHKCSYEKYEIRATCLENGTLQEKCSQCGNVTEEQTLDPLGHDFKMSIWETSTCLKGGYYNNICQRCGLVECVTEDALPHDVEDITIQEGNCMEDTIIRHVCKNCGQQIDSDTRFTPQVHEWAAEIVDGAEAVYCSRCGVMQ